MHFQLGKLQSQGNPFVGKGSEFLVGGKLLTHFTDKLRTNELGGALAPVAITKLVKRSMFLWVDRIHAFASGFLAGRVLLGKTPRSHLSNLQ